MSHFLLPELWDIIRSELGREDAGMLACTCKEEWKKRVRFKRSPPLAPVHSETVKWILKEQWYNPPIGTVVVSGGENIYRYVQWAGYVVETGRTTVSIVATHLFINGKLTYLGRTDTRSRDITSLASPPKGSRIAREVAEMWHSTLVAKPRETV